MIIKSLLSIFRNSLNSFEGQREGEKILLLLRRHRFIILTRMGFFLLGALVPIIVGQVFLNYLSANDFGSIFLFVSSVWYMWLWLGIFRALTIYSLSTVVITNERVIDSDQHSLFDRKIAELNNDRIQDVSIHTSGIIETLFRFGDVTVQTAASERQFVFHKIPRPNDVKDAIMKITASRNSGIKVSKG